MELGHSVMLLHQYNPDGQLIPTPEHFSHIDKVVESRYSFPIKRSPIRTIRQLVGIWRRPWHVAKSVPSGEDREAVDTAARKFRPDLIWLDGPWLGETGVRLAKEFRVPIAYRSHNVEHVYLRRQAKASPSRRNQLAWALAAVGVKRQELKLMKASSRVLDISLDDLAFWEKQGITNNRWLPPLPELALTGPPAEAISGDIVFVGGLSLPNNIRGVRWLVDEVLPIVRQQRPELTVSIVGSSPQPDLKSDLEANPSVRTFYNVPSVQPYLFGAKVLVNPVAIGSGVQLKILDMLMTDAPIVTTTQGIGGLPPECVAQVDVADTAELFAAAILRHVDGPMVNVEEREHSRGFFSMAAVREAIADIA